MKTLKDITFESKEESGEITNIRVETVESFKKNLREYLQKWMQGHNTIIDLYCEIRDDDGFEGGLSDDDVMKILENCYPEEEFIDFSDDDLSRFYFLFDFLNHFLNLENK